MAFHRPHRSYGRAPANIRPMKKLFSGQVWPLMFYKIHEQPSTSVKMCLQCEVAALGRESSRCCRTPAHLHIQISNNGAKIPRKIRSDISEVCERGCAEVASRWRQMG